MNVIIKSCHALPLEGTRLGIFFLCEKFIRPARDGGDTVGGASIPDLAGKTRHRAFALGVEKEPHFLG